MPDKSTCAISLTVVLPLEIASPTMTFAEWNKDGNYALGAIGMAGNTSVLTYGTSGAFPAANGHNLTFSGTYQATAAS